MFDYTMSNIMDSFYDNAMSTATDGIFKAVCLSGIRTEDGSGAGTDSEDAINSNQFLSVVVRPLADFGNILPDPRASNDPDTINKIISLHASTFMARSDFEFKDTDPIQFGQILDCYFEQGSIQNSDFKGLRFMKPQGTQIEISFLDLATIDGVETILSADWANATLLGDNTAADAATANGKSSNIKGDRSKDVKYIVIHYSAAFGGKESVLKYENRNTDYGYHYMIGRNGTFFNSADPEKIVWHAKGNSKVNNSNSIGICIMNAGFERDGVTAKSNWISGKTPNGSSTKKWEPYEETSLSKCADICAELLKKYSLDQNAIVGHSDIQSDKSDPGPAFDMKAFRERVAKKL